LELRVESLEKEIVALKTPVVKQEEVPQPAQETTAPQAQPFPHEWRNVIDETLSAKFGASVDYRGVDFELTILVPKEYSNANPNVWAEQKADRRIWVIPNHMGTAGVKDFADKVAKNLGQEIMNRVIEDRTK
jgi:hypothetical protein